MNSNIIKFAGWALVILPILLHVFFGAFYGAGENEDYSVFLTEATNNIYLSKFLLLAGNASMIFLLISIVLITNSYANNSDNPLFGKIAGLLFLILLTGGFFSFAMELRALDYFNENKADEALAVWSLIQGSGSGPFELIQGLGIIFFGKAIRDTKNKIQPNLLLNIISFGMLIFGIIQIINAFGINALEILGVIGWFGPWILFIAFGVGLLRSKSSDK